MLKTSVLIVTLQSNFGASIRDGLDPSLFDSYITSDFSEAVHFVRQSNCGTVLLDTQLEDQELSVMDIGYGLRQLKADLQFIVVIRPGQVVDAETLTPLAMLSTPVSLSELTRLLRKPSGTAGVRKAAVAASPEPKSAQEVPSNTQRLVWLTDVSKAAQHLTQLTLESSAQAAFITRQNDLWAYAGQLSREAAQELNGTIQRDMDASGQSDVLRFVRLKSTAAQHMLYVRKLSTEMTLALVFDAETPFSTIRSQAGKLVKNLFDNPAASGQSLPPADPNLTTTFAPDDQAAPSDFQDMPPISEVLGDVPVPTPLRSALTSALPWEQPANAQRPVSQPVRPRVAAQPPKPAPLPANSLNRETETSERPSTSAPKRDAVAETVISTPAPKRDAVAETVISTPAPKRDAVAETVVSTPAPKRDSVAETVVSTPAGVPVKRAPADLDATRKQEDAFDPQSVAETRAQDSGEAMSDTGHRILIESPSMTQVNLSYACVLIPRFEQHYLVGDMATRLNAWLLQLCVAYGWRLEYISVRPNYLQWIARVHLNTSAGHVIKLIRLHTSDRMFAEFPRLKIENPSGEFWAPGFVVHGGSQPHQQQDIRNFIAQTRARQGLR